MIRHTSALALAGVLAACASTKDESPSVKTSLATTTAGDLTVELLAEEPLSTGLTPIWLAVRTSGGAAVTDATVTFVPVMSMTGGTVHSAPTLAAPALDAGGLYRCDVVFQMASSAMGAWSAEVTVARGGGAPVAATFDALAVSDSGRAKTFAYTDPDTSVTTKYVASFDLDAAPAVGLNPVTVTLHRMVEMMTFAPVDDATLALTPFMTSMGHGAEGSVSPTLASPGVYHGAVAFSMSGGQWDTTLTVTRGGVVIGAPVFSTTF